MNVSIRPQFEKFIDEQVKAGRFSSADEALEAGVARLMLDPEPDVLEERDLADIEASLEEVRQGKVVDAREFHKEIRRRYLNEQ